MFREHRDSGIFFLGSGEESYGNQVLQLKPGDTGFLMQLRKDKPYERDGNYITMPVAFSYMSEELAYALSSHQPVTYRISRKGRKWYLTAMFSMDMDIYTDKKSGVIGIDYNDGFMEVVETDRYGNMASAKQVGLEYHGTGKKAESELKEKLSKLVRVARDKGKNIIVEDLDFRKKKARQMKGYNKKDNRRLHRFDYHRYLFWLEQLCIKYGVQLRKVNPAYTSQIGRKKYSNNRKLTVHRAAAFVIARRGQGYEDKVTA